MVTVFVPAHWGHSRFFGSHRSQKAKWDRVTKKMPAIMLVNIETSSSKAKLNFALQQKTLSSNQGRERLLARYHLGSKRLFSIS
jgi:hypothetical protein